MNAPTDVQIINDADGNPAYVVIPYAQYVAQKIEPDLIPHEVVSRIVTRFEGYDDGGHRSPWGC